MRPHPLRDMLGSVWQEGLTRRLYCIVCCGVLYMLQMADIEIGLALEI